MYITYIMHINMYVYVYMYVHTCLNLFKYFAYSLWELIAFVQRPLLDHRFIEDPALYFVANQLRNSVRPEFSHLPCCSQMVREQTSASAPLVNLF